MKLFEGMTETRRTELMAQLRAEWSHDSTAIEGNTLSLGETMFVLEYGLTVEELIETYARLHLGFTAIHPFFDGNGRLARLLANIPVLFAGHPPIVIPSEEREEYLKALWCADAPTSDIEPFKTLIRSSWAKTLDLVKAAQDAEIAQRAETLVRSKEISRG